MNLLRTIYSSNWMLHPDAATGFLPLIAQLIKGNSVSFDQTPQIKSYIVSATGGSASGNPVQGRVAVVPIRGVILKDSQECGPRGLEETNMYLRDCINDSRIDAIVLDLDTPGGQASFLETFTNTIKSSNKPIIAYYNNLCASAGYYIASACDEIYASEQGDEVGSIGTMANLADYTGFFENMGVKVHQLYAKQSTNKNKGYRQITSGDPEQVEAGKANYIDNMLTPIAQFFIDHVKANRSTISNEEVFTGSTYLSAEAIDLGLIDGVKSLGDVITRALDLSCADNPSSTNQNSNQNTNSMKNNFQAVATLLGYEAIEAKDDMVSLSTADVEKINAAIATGSADTTTETATAAAVDHSAEIEALETKVSALETGIAGVNASITALGEKLDAAITGTSIDATKTEIKEDDTADGIEALAAPFEG